MSAYCFTNHVRGMSSDIPLQLVDLESDVAMFQTEYDGEKYYVALKDIPEGYILSCLSNCVFQHGCCPSKVSNALIEMNKRTDGPVWDIANGKNGKKYVVSQVVRQNINASMTTEIFGQLISQAIGLDSYLRKHNFA